MSRPMTRRLLPGLVGALIGTLCCAAAALSAEPSLEVIDGRWLTLHELPPILDNEEVAPELESGLTTTFVFVVDLQGIPDGKTAGAARIGIRYELWDEVFHVTLYGLAGLERQVIDSREELRSWWRALSLRIVDLDGPGDLPDTGPRGRRSAREARVRLDVVPFSQSEQVDTQRWFAESVRRAEATGSQGESSVVVDSEGGDSVFSLLIATSIRSRPLTTYTWTLELPAAPKP
jgi:hypothetical protein